MLYQIIVLCHDRTSSFVIVLSCRHVTLTFLEVGEIAQSAPYIIQTGRAGSENVQFFIACESKLLFF